MPKLTEAQRIILSAASQRTSGLVLPLPKAINLNKAAVTKVLNSLLGQKFITERAAERGQETWRTEKDQRLTLVITDAGLAAVGGTPGAEPSTMADRPNAAERKSKRAAPAAPPATTRTKIKASPHAMRPGSKLVLLIELFKRKNGATLAEAMKATGWQAHSIRGAISGALKKRMGLTVTSEQMAERGRVYRVVND